MKLQENVADFDEMSRCFPNPDKQELDLPQRLEGTKKCLSSFGAWKLAKYYVLICVFVP